MGVISHSRQMVNVFPFTTNWAANIQIHLQDNIFKSTSIFNSYVFNKLLSNENQYFHLSSWETVLKLCPAVEDLLYAFQSRKIIHDQVKRGILGAGHVYSQGGTDFPSTRES